MRQSVRWALYREIDQVLVEDGKEVGLVLSELSRQGLDAVADELRRKATGHAQHRWFARLVDAGGERVWGTALADVSPSSSTTGQFATVNEYRIYRVEAPTNAVGVRRVELGSSLAPLRSELRRVDQIVGGASCLLLLLAPLCGYWLSALATRDLATMTARAARLSPTGLDDRLPERGVDDELDRLAQTVNRLLDRIAEFIQEKREFLANAAHDLRTPIAAIRSSAEVALARDRTNSEYRELLEELIEDTEPLEVLVNQLLLLSEATAADAMAPKATVSLSEVTLKAVDMFSGVAESRGVALVVRAADGVAVDGVRQHLMQAVTNLIDNALKYTAEGGEVEVTLEASPDRRARLRVRDTGVGIDPVDIPRVFDRFFRTDRSRGRDGVGGSGLGLSICRTIVEAHNGRVHCESVPGEGSVFEFILPLSRHPDTPAVAATDSTANITNA